MCPVLAKGEIEKLLHGNFPLIEGYIDLDTQIQPNGFDLTVRDICIFLGYGTIGKTNDSRIISSVKQLSYESSGYVNLPSGPYLVTFNEIVHLPRNLMAIGKPRSSLLRCGVTVHNAVWDAGYSGRSQALMVVYNEHGFRLERNARILQLIFLSLSSEADGYSGIYQNENL